VIGPRCQHAVEIHRRLLVAALLKPEQAQLIARAGMRRIDGKDLAVEPLRLRQRAALVKIAGPVEQERNILCGCPGFNNSPSGRP
jgi:hypothetical protein